MSDEPQGSSWEDTIRAMAREVRESVDQLGDLDIDDLARRAGLDPDRARGWLDEAGQWLRIQVEHVEFPSGGVDPSAGAPVDDRPAGASWHAVEPHPLDLPTADQGAALAALDSGRWSLEPGTEMLVGHGEGPAPRDALGLVRELRARDWLATDGTLTLTGRHALGRWLDAAVR